MGSSIFDVIKEQRAKENKVVELGKVMDDGKPCAIRVRPLRIADYFALGQGIPMPSGQASEWTHEERGRYFAVIKRMIPSIVTQARHVAKTAASNGAPEFVESWIDVRVVESNPNYEQNEMSIDDLEALGTGIGDTLIRIGNAVLADSDTGGEMTTLPQGVDPETGEPFRVESVVDSGASVVGGTAAATA